MRKYKKMSKFVNNTGYTPGTSSESNPINIIPSKDITMENTPYPVYGQPLDKFGNPISEPTYMEPGMNYDYGSDAAYVAETPAYKDGGMKQSWISDKIGELVKEGRPQKQAIAIAYSMWEQKHKMGGYQLPKYQFAGTAELDQYGQPLPKLAPTPTFYQNSTVNGQKPFAPGSFPENDRDNNGVPDTIQKVEGNPLVGVPTAGDNLKPQVDYNKEYMNMSLADEQLKTNDGGDTARKNAEESGIGMTQFINPYGDVGLDDALAFTGKSAANGNIGATVGGAALSLLKGTKSFLQGMGAQKRQNQVMKDYAEEQRKNMTGEGREQSLKMGGYYEDGGEEDMGYEDDIISKYPNSSRIESEIAARNPVFGPQGDGEETNQTMTARDTWEAKTNMPWSEAKRLGYTDGSSKDNIKLLSELNDERFKKENLRSNPIKVTPRKANKKSPTWYKEGIYKKAYDESDFKDDIDRNKQPYPEDADFINTKKPVTKATTKKAQVTRKAAPKNYTQQELDAVWGSSRTYNPIAELVDRNKKKPQPKGNTDKRKLQSGVITDKSQNMTHVIENGKVVKSFPVLTGQNPDGNSNNYTVEQLESNKKGRVTPTGTYIMKPNANIYGKRGFDLNPISAFGEAAPDALNVALHTMYGTNPNKGEAGYDPAEGKKRMKAVNSSNPNDRYGSYGCINGKCEDTEDLADRFQKSDTLMVVDSRKLKDKALLSRFGIKRDGGYYQEGGMQSPMEESMEGQMSNPQEEGMEQQGGDQMQAIVQQVAQMLQQGADPQEILQQLVQAGIPQEQAQQIIQMVMQQMQGGQQEATPQLKCGGKMYQEGGEMMDEQMEGEDEGAEGETPNMEQIESQVEQALKQGADPEQILEQLVQMGMSEEQAIQMIQEILQEIQGGETEMEGPEQGQPMMRNGGEYLAMMKGKTIKNYTYNKKTGNYDVEFE